jgi:hypothetical protein
MTEAAQRFLRSFKALAQADQHDVLVTLLRLPIESDYAAPSDEELVAAANAVFLELDKAETGQ